MIIYFIIAIMALLYGLILGLVIMHTIMKPKIQKLLETIKELQDKAELSPSLNIGRLLTLFIIANVLVYQSQLWGGMVEFAFDVIAVVLLAVFLVGAQTNLNSYWEHIKGRQLAEARIGVGEVIFVLIGLAFWVTYYVL